MLASKLTRLLAASLTVAALHRSSDALADPSARAWAIGVRGALQWTDLNDRQVEVRQSFAAGGVFLARGNASAAVGAEFQGEALLSDKRVSRDIEGGTEVVRMRYIDLPLLFRLSRRGTAARPFLLGGPVLSFLVDAHIWIDTPTVQVDREHKGIKSFDWAAQVGAGAELPLGHVAPTFDIRYSYGFGTIADDSSGKHHTRVLSVSVGALF